MGLAQKLLRLLPILVAIDLALLYASVLEGPFPSQVPLGTPMAYRNIYVHVPVAWGSYVLFAAAMISGLVYLLRGNRLAAKLAPAYAVLGALFAAATLATGSAWASESWGAPWNWDPKQTAVLLLFLAYTTVIPLRRSIPDPERRDVITSVYVVASFVMVPIAFLSSRLLAESLHPSIEAAGDFSQVGGPIVASLFLGRSLIVSVIALLLGYALATGVRPRGVAVLAAVYIGAGLLLSIIIAAPLLSGEYYRVVDVTITSGGLVKSVTLNNGETISFEDPVESPINPAVLPDGRSTLVGHIIKIKASGDGIEVLYHWSTPFTVLVYSAIIAVSLFLLHRGWTP